MAKLFKKGAADDLYNEMAKYSRSKSVFYQSVSPLDIKKVDAKIQKALMDNPQMAQVNCEEGVPFILSCVDCGMKESVKWFLTKQNAVSKSIADWQGENIAIYAYKVGLNDLVDFCASVTPSLMDQRDLNGLSVNARKEIKKKEQELNRGR